MLGLEQHSKIVGLCVKPRSFERETNVEINQRWPKRNFLPLSCDDFPKAAHTEFFFVGGEFSQSCFLGGGLI